jgi:DNA-directed RNA polymerase subunit RPC12/RpoP
VTEKIKITLDELIRQQGVSHEVAQLAQWLCLKCGQRFPGERLFGRFEPGERLNRCPYCDSVTIVIPERLPR